MEGQVRRGEEGTTAATAMAEMQRQYNNSGSSKVADQDKQVESTMNINECASCTTQVLHWRDASDAGRMEMNV